MKKALIINKLRKRFGGKVVLNDLDFIMNYGDKIGIIGPNGSGKTTFFNVISGIYRADSGKIEFAGRDIKYAGINKISRLGIIRTFQKPRIFPNFTVLENMSLSYIGKEPTYTIGKLIFNKMSKCIGEEYLYCVKYFLDKISLLEKADELAGNLSFGEKKLLEICRAICHSDSFVFLDEPSAGLNISRQEQVINILKGINNLTVCIIEHNHNFLYKIADKKYIMDRGMLRKN